LTLLFKDSNLASLRLYDALLLPLAYSLTGFIVSAFDLANAQIAINLL
jgi:hypothetical protein